MDEEYLEAVLDVVGAIPRGRVMTYGTIADTVADRFTATGSRVRGGPRQVGHVLSRAGSGVPWWRVVDAAGLPPAFKREHALGLLASEGAPLAGAGSRVDLRTALWWPDDAA
ncbi:MGMT family protein [Cellulomonas fimi]|uniref:Cysteine methyltransferase n=1 Tax=Cellulomonas fimi TaxID=1708 RepID=A0A7Y0LX79_CELFI|nr:MGMT family protein [Cellulomonas fimi]NMR19640.1 cysteine methyltransferase [Cellulomonas fimi]